MHDRGFFHRNLDIILIVFLLTACSRQDTPAPEHPEIEAGDEETATSDRCTWAEAGSDWRTGERMTASNILAESFDGVEQFSNVASCQIGGGFSVLYVIRFDSDQPLSPEWPQSPGRDPLSPEELIETLRVGLPGLDLPSSTPNDAVLHRAITRDQGNVRERHLIRVSRQHYILVFSYGG